MPFTTLGLPSALVKGVRAAGFGEPTPLQRKAIPIILKGNDLIGAAQSGTGKTASYLLPTLTRLMEGPRRLRALVLAPTRELCVLVEAAARAFGRFTHVRATAVFGGVPLAGQERFVREEGTELLIATPARLLELHGRQAINFEDVEILVLEEADRMVDMGMATDLRRILKALPETRQTLLFSATMPPELNRLAKEALVEPLRVDLAPPTKPAAGITQAIYPVPRALKSDLLHEIFTRGEVRSVIVFTSTRASADQLSRQLEKRGHRVASLHGSANQMQRERAVNDLKRGRVQILVATDVASRGIDTGGISHVVNYDVPHRPEDYLHRLGRTGQGDAAGDAFTLMSPEEQTAVAAPREPETRGRCEIVRAGEREGRRRDLRRATGPTGDLGAGRGIVHDDDPRGRRGVSRSVGCGRAERVRAVGHRGREPRRRGRRAERRQGWVDRAAERPAADAEHERGDRAPAVARLGLEAHVAPHVAPTRWR